MQERGINLAIIGDLAHDKVITPHGNKTTIAGATYNVAVAASSVAKDKRVGVVAQVGTDFKEGIAALEQRDIDIEGIKIIPDGKTAVFTIREHEDGTRTLVSQPGVSSEVAPSNFPKSYEGALHVHLASSHPTKYLVWIPYLRHVLPDNTILSADGNDFYLDVTSIMKDALDQVDLIFINEAELAAIKERFPDYKLPKPTILKKGSNGASYIDLQEGIEISVKAPKVTVVDTTGAGDTLAGVYLTKRLEGASIHQALQDGVDMASNVVTDFGVEHIHPLATTGSL